MAMLARRSSLPLPFVRPSEASFYGGYTFSRHLCAALLDAVSSGVLLLNEYVATKALHASAYGVTVLLMLPTVAQLGNLYWTGIRGRDPRVAFLWVGAARLAVIALAWTSSAFWFVVLASIASTASTIVIPAQNAIYQANYAPGERGRLFSRVSASAAVVSVVVATLLGWVYDQDEQLYRISYPLAGLVAAGGAVAWYRIRWRRRPDHDAGLSAAGPVAVAAVPRGAGGSALVRVGRGVSDPFRSAVRLFDEDRDFLRFECAFMTYGIAYMMIQPVIPIFLVHELKVDYSQASHAKGLLFYLLMVLFLPWAGRLNDRVGSLRVATASFLMLSLFPVLLLLAHGIGMVYLAYAAFGIAMAGVNVTWTLGPLSMAGTRSAERYMGAHVSLVGVRGLIGYPLGLALMSLASPRATFAVAAVLALCAGAIMGPLAARRGTGGSGGG